MAKSLTELGLDINDLEIMPEPQFETPYEFLAYYAPKQDWSATHTLTWEDIRNHPGLQAIFTNVVMLHTLPLALRKKA